MKAEFLIGFAMGLVEWLKDQGVRLDLLEGMEDDLVREFFGITEEARPEQKQEISRRSGRAEGLNT